MSHWPLTHPVKAALAWSIAQLLRWLSPQAMAADIDLHFRHQLYQLRDY